MDPILRQALRKHNGLRTQLENMLLGDDGDEVEAELKNFVAKRSCWTDKGKGDKKKYNNLRVSINLNYKPALPHALEATVNDHTDYIGGERPLTVTRGSGVTILFEKRTDGLYIDGKKVLLYRSERQMNGGSIYGHDLRKELDGKPVLNACVLDFLMANQEFIPEDWRKEGVILFWGTIFRSSSGELCLHGMEFQPKFGEWWYSQGWLNRHPDETTPAAMLESA